MVNQREKLEQEEDLRSGNDPDSHVADKMEQEENWEQFFEEHGRSLLLYARQLTGSIAEAEDALQQGFVRFWKSKASMRGDKLACLYVAVRRSALDRHRSDERRGNREKLAGMMEARQYFEPESGLERDERRKAIEGALVELPEEQREVVTMKIWGELTFKQIAEILEESENTVASRYRYGIEKLRQLLRTSSEI